MVRRSTPITCTACTPRTPPPRPAASTPPCENAFSLLMTGA